MLHIVLPGILGIQTPTRRNDGLVTVGSQTMIGRCFTRSRTVIEAALERRKAIL